MSDPFREELPDEIRVPFEDLRQIIVALDQLGETEREAGRHEAAGVLEDVLGRMTRWVWQLLRDLDEEGGYDA